jgi:hypothetical protein
MKTVRVHFDYNELTDFEKLVMRNTLLFYTWMKRNPMLQAQGMVTRPALYTTQQNISHAREEFPNEPDYFKDQGLFPNPFGAGGVGPIGNPQMDVLKADMSMENFRKNVFGAVNPIARVPFELAFNKSTFTGAPIERYTGENKPSGVARGLAALGIPVPMSRSRAGGELQPALPANVEHTLRQFYGPVGSTLTNISDPESEASTLAAIIKRISGIEIQQNQPEKFERSAKYREAKRKADETRKRNAEAR